MGILDRLPASLRHAILVAAGIVFTAIIQWVQTDYTNWGLPPQAVAVLGFAIPMVINYLTPLTTTQYGVGSTIPADFNSEETAVVTEEMAGH